MRHLRLSAVLLTLVAALVVIGGGPAAAGAAPSCATDQVMVRGRLFDAATRLPITTPSGVEFYEADGTPIDGGGVEPNGRWYSCWDPTANQSIKVRFFPDEYRPEWWQDAADVNTATVVDIPAAPADPIVLNAYITPQGRVLSGRVTNLAGAPRDASVGIWRLSPSGWRPIDGLGNDHRTGIWSFRVPTLGRYRISADVDSHSSRWYRNATRLRFATTVTVGLGTTYISGLDIRVPFCHPAPTFCVPPGFYS